VSPRWLLLGIAFAVVGCPRKEPAPATLPEAAPRSSAPAPSAAVPASAFDERREERAAMVRNMRSEGVKDERVLAAMNRVPRHAFVSDAVSDLAYADRPLPIGSGQTISQPFIVAFMTAAASPAPGDRCLEIGTGSGYQAAVLAELCKETYSIEYLPELAENAKKTLRSLGYGPRRVHLRTGDGYVGWKEAAPFDVIVVTAAPERVPKPLLEQLAVGGRLVIPVGGEHETQALERWTREKAGAGRGALGREHLLDVRFVPFLGDAG